MVVAAQTGIMIPPGKHQWRNSLTTWHVASINIPATNNIVRFRIVITSDLGYNLEGVGIDDIHVFDKAAIYTVCTGNRNYSVGKWQQLDSF